MQWNDINGDFNDFEGAFIETTPVETQDSSKKDSDTHAILSEINDENILDICNKLRNTIPDEYLYTGLVDGGNRRVVNGWGGDFHITIFFGLYSSDAQSDELERILKSNLRIVVGIEGIDYFESDGYDVCILKCRSNELENLHYSIDDMYPENMNKFDKYSPHITISYVKKGFRLDDKVEMILPDNMEFIIDNYVIDLKEYGEKIIKDDLEGGLGDKFVENDFDSEQVRKGIDVEYEHTNNREIAREIALDHLAEIPDYYNRLGRMEEDAKRAGLYKKVHKSNDLLLSAIHLSAFNTKPAEYSVDREFTNMYGGEFPLYSFEIEGGKIVVGLLPGIHFKFPFNNVEKFGEFSFTYCDENNNCTNDIINRGEPFKTLSTVIQIARDISGSSPYDVVAIGGLDQSKRLSVYENMAKMFDGKIGYNYIGKNNEGSFTVFYFVKDGVNVEIDDKNFDVYRNTKVEYEIDRDESVGAFESMDIINKGWWVNYKNGKEYYLASNNAEVHLQLLSKLNIIPKKEFNKLFGKGTLANVKWEDMSSMIKDKKYRDFISALLVKGWVKVRFVEIRNSVLAFECLKDPKAKKMMEKWIINKVSSGEISKPQEIRITLYEDNLNDYTMTFDWYEFLGIEEPTGYGYSSEFLSLFDGLKEDYDNSKNIYEWIEFDERNHSYAFSVEGDSSSRVHKYYQVYFNDVRVIGIPGKEVIFDYNEDIDGEHLDTIKITKSENPFKILFTVIDIIKDYISSYGLDALLFTANNNESTRVKMYRLASNTKMMSGMDFLGEYYDGRDINFLFIKSNKKFNVDVTREEFDKIFENGEYNKEVASRILLDDEYKEQVSGDYEPIGDLANEKEPYHVYEEEPRRHISYILDDLQLSQSSFNEFSSDIYDDFMLKELSSDIKTDEDIEDYISILNDFYGYANSVYGSDIFFIDLLNEYINNRGITHTLIGVDEYGEDVEVTNALQYNGQYWDMDGMHDSLMDIKNNFDNMYDNLRWERS